MTASVVYEVFKALSFEEQGNFMALLQQKEKPNQDDIKLPSRIRKKQKPITNKEAIDLLLNTVFTKPSSQNRKNRK